MSLDVVSKKIEGIAKKPLIKEADIDEVIVAAERSLKGRSDGVSNAEARAVADLYLRTKAQAARTPKVEDAAVTKLNAFFIDHNLPYGANKAPMKSRILHSIGRRGGDLGAHMTRPPRTGSLQPLLLTDPGAVPRQDAYVDVVKKRFVLRVSDGVEAKFYGPFALPDAAAT